MAHRGSFRASDLDREQVAERLRQAVTDGRLLADEFEHRLARALRARTYAELNPLVADLPGKRLAERGGAGLSPLAGAAAAITVAVVAVTVVALAALAITGILAAWTMWMLVTWWFFGRTRRARRARGRHHPQAGLRLEGRRGML